MPSGSHSGPPGPGPIFPTNGPNPTNGPAPVNPTNGPAPVNPTNGPPGPFPSNGPVNPSNAPFNPSNAPFNPTNGPVNPSNAPFNPTNGPVNPTNGPGPNPITNAPVTPVTTQATPVTPATTPVTPATTQASTPAATFSKAQQDAFKAEAEKLIDALPASLNVTVSGDIEVSPAGVVTLTATIEGGCTAVTDNAAKFGGKDFNVECVAASTSRRLLAVSSVNLTLTPKQGATYAPGPTQPATTNGATDAPAQPATTKSSPASSAMPSALAFVAVVVAALAF
jgi:hypothetical protein